MDFEQNQSVVSYEREYNASFHKLLKMLTLSILISFIGTLAGIAVPPVLFMPLIIVEFVMLISAIFVRRRKKAIGYGFTFGFCFISGITLYPTIAYYASVGGFTLVNTAFLITTAMFAGLTAYAYWSKKDFSFLGGFLFMGLIALVGFSIIGMFTGSFAGPIICVFGTLIFSGYILFDISRMKHGLADEDIPRAVITLYLDFLNLFLYVLRLLGLSRD
ncbi:Bax inhibitor-1 family protein [Gorillibacterium massiliense]|uniref:Bax inhibitor-1/YccA family protein n=1 Tax=Gorillibacterium massiliense TaxID=1280390 RepID=UPI0004B9DFC5|nr:Bax inhibitor-1/YccA family protein [Gorillibacterium massiliense]